MKSYPDLESGRRADRVRLGKTVASASGIFPIGGRKRKRNPSLEVGRAVFPQSWAPDGSVIACLRIGASGSEIWIVPLDDARRAWPFFQSPFAEAQPDFSPDGRWIAYASNESGCFEVFVRPYPGPGGKIQVSNDGGFEPAWRRDGKELFYRSGAKMMSVAVRPGSANPFGKPVTIFEKPGLYREPNLERRLYDVAPDGTRFVMLRAIAAGSPPQLRVLTGWTELARQPKPAR